MLNVSFEQWLITISLTSKGVLAFGNTAHTRFSARSVSLHLKKLNFLSSFSALAAVVAQRSTTRLVTERLGVQPPPRRVLGFFLSSNHSGLIKVEQQY